jgi:hypothetical protein
MTDRDQYDSTVPEAGAADAFRPEAGGEQGDRSRALVADAGPAPLLGDTYLRLIPDDYLPADAMGGFRYLRPVADGLLEAIALDAPDSVRILNDQDVARVGLDTLRAAGRANLVSEPVEYETTTRPEDGTPVHLVSGESMFVASKALVLAELMRLTIGQEPSDNGALVAVPSRHLLAYHPIADGRAVTALNDLASFAVSAYRDNPGPVSPRLFWWRAGALTCLTTLDRDTRRLTTTPPAELVALLNGLPAARR